MTSSRSEHEEGENGDSAEMNSCRCPSEVALRVSPKSQVEFLLRRFSPGVGNDPAPSTGTMKRRTQSLSALPKDGDRKVSPPCRPSDKRAVYRMSH